MKRTSILLTFLILAAASPRVARAEVIERVVAVVGPEAIFLSELRRRAAPFLEQTMQAPTESERIRASAALYQRVLEQMVQEELFIQAADDMSVSVTSAEVDRAIENVRNQASLSEEQFWQAVAGQGFTREQYRGDVRRQLLRLKVLNHRARDRVNITEDEVRDRYRMQVARGRREAQFRASHIFVELADGASATATRDARQHAEELRARATSPQSFRAAGGISLGVLSEGSLPQVLEDVLVQMEPGEISQVVRGPAGFHVFLLEGRQHADNALPEYDTVRMRIYQEMMEEAMTRQEALFIAELRRSSIVELRL